MSFIQRRPSWLGLRAGFNFLDTLEIEVPHSSTCGPTAFLFLYFMVYKNKLAKCGHSNIIHV